MKMYFEVGREEHCFPLDNFKDRIFDGEEKIYLALAVVDYGSGYFYCTVKGECGESGDFSCGKICKDYKPRNKKNGRCRYSINTYCTGKEFVLTKDGLKEVSDGK